MAHLEARRHRARAGAGPGRQPVGAHRRRRGALHDRRVAHRRCTRRRLARRRAWADDRARDDSAAGPRAARTPPIGVRFVDWADEEGARFSRSLLGSSACAGTLDPDEVRDLRDAEGVTLADALAGCGVDLDDAPAAAERLKGAVAYLELHIEQGPVLLDGGRLACAVSGTVGVERHLMTFTGQAAHAGSTPMRLRQDSLAAAARAALDDTGERDQPRRRRHRRADARDSRRHHRRCRQHRDAARPAAPRPGRARRDVRRGAGGVPQRGRGVQLHCRRARRLPRDPDPVRPSAGRARPDERAGSGRRRGRADPERPIARRDRDRPGRPDGDDLRSVGPADLARVDRGFARAGAECRDRCLRKDRGARCLPEPAK